MTIKELKELIEQNNIPKEWYSLDSERKDDCVYLLVEAGIYELFYLDPREGDFRLGAFDNEAAACDTMWVELEKMMKLYNHPLLSSFATRM